MNKSYKVVFSKARSALVVVSEATTSCRKACSADLTHVTAGGAHFCSAVNRMQKILPKNGLIFVSVCFGISFNSLLGSFG